MFKKLFIFLSFFFISAIPAYAHCTITVDNTTLINGMEQTVNFTVIPDVNIPGFANLGSGSYSGLVTFGAFTGIGVSPHVQFVLPINAPITTNGVTFSDASSNSPYSEQPNQIYY